MPKAITINDTMPANFPRRYRCALLLLACILCPPSLALDRPLSVKPTEPSAKASQHPQQLIIKLNSPTKTSNAESAAMHRKLGVGNNQLRHFRHLPQLQVVHLPPNLSLTQALDYYREQPQVAYAEPDFRVRITNITPNDPGFSEQWHLGDAGINATEAWEQNVGDANVVIAVLDTGIDYQHPDLQDNLWRNPGETLNGQDSDNNGYVDDLYGINTETRSGDPMDSIGHGTHVAGIIAATGNNGLGVAGVSWRSQLLACRFIDDQGYGDTSDAIACLDYLYDLKVNRGVNIVASNNSWGSTSFSQALYDAIALQAEAGILFVTGAGNLGSQQPFYPGAYELPNIITLAAHTAKGQRAAASNLGRHWVDLAAPGQEILSTWPDNTYREDSGTSMAAPIATGVIALLASALPQLDWRLLRARLLASGAPATDTNLRNHTRTGKLLKVWAEDGGGALNCNNQQTHRRLQPSGDLYLSPGDPVAVQLMALDCDGPIAPGRAFRLDTGTEIPLNDLGQGEDKHAGDGIYSGSLSFPGASLELRFELPEGDETLSLREPQISYCTQQNINQIPRNQCDALVALYYATAGSEWLRRDGWVENSQPCDWFGVNCTPENTEAPDEPRQVRQLLLVNNRLRGALPTNLGNLSQLQRLDLSQNQLSGPWPASLAQLQQLEILWLWSNPLEGQLPSELGQLARLRSLDLTQTQISGPLPESFSQLSDLENLYLADNRLSGSLDPLVGLQSLRHLDLGNNQFSGSPLALLQAHPQLERLHLGGNNLEGQPLPLISQMSGLQSLTLYGNRFTGQIPASFGNLHQLELAYLSDNEFAGFLPNSLGQLQALDTLLLTGNRGLHGPLPENLTQLGALDFLDTGDTALCVPDSNALDAWLAGLNRHNPWRYCRDNQAPVIAALSNKTATSGSPVELSVQASDADGDLLSYEWTQVSGPSVVINNNQTANASFTAPDVSREAILVFQVSVSDGIDSLSATTSVETEVAAKASSGGGAVNSVLCWLLVLIGLRICLLRLRTFPRSKCPATRKTQQTLQLSLTFSPTIGNH